MERYTDNIGVWKQWETLNSILGKNSNLKKHPITLSSITNTISEDFNMHFLEKDIDLTNDTCN